MEAGKRRYVGLDIGKRTYAMAVIGKNGKVSHSNGRTDSEGRTALYGNLAFIIAWEIIKQVGCEVVVLNAGKLALIYGSMKKTDKENALKLARIVAQFLDDQLPSVPLPSEQEMRRRKLICSYERVKRLRTKEINTLHGLFVHQGITTLTKQDLARAAKREKAVEALNGLERDEADWLREELALIDKRLSKLETAMAVQREGDTELERLVGGGPGVGPIVSLAYVAYIGDGSRFENAAHVSNYLGLVPHVDISGTLVKYGGITKQGNTYVRALLVEAA